MATDNTMSNTFTGLSVIGTTGERVRELPISDGQLVFIHNRNRIAFDFKGKRTFYNQVEILSTESERASIVSPMDGYYFCIDSAVFYEYANGEWNVRVRPADGAVIICDEYPELGQLSGKLYVNKKQREIAIWDEANNKYYAVSNHTQDATDEDIMNLFVGM